jgi:predicted O-methyltransferase YrrM
MLQGAVNIGRNSLRWRNFTVMAEKVVLRLKERGLHKEKVAVAEWCRAHVQSCEAFARSLDPALWEETQAVCADLERAGRKRLAELGLNLGGGGNYPLLYFLVRALKPACVVETGVAAGWSSNAMLHALDKNGQGGRLYSSDFPYFRYAHPERLVGYVVEERLKKRWKLYIDGDRYNLPVILKECGPIGLFHYDSDKSAAGRQFALELVADRLADGAAVIFDDIQDNGHFRDYVEKTGTPFRVFSFGGKYLGMTGL